MPANPRPEAPDEIARQVARQYQELVNSLDDVVFRFDESGRWTYLSPAWEKWLGWDTARCLGRSVVKFVDPPSRGHVLRHWTEVLAGRLDSYRREVRFREAGGGCRWMLVSARGLRAEDGTLQGVTGTLTDVSAAKELEAELIAARAAADVANKAKSEFLATMSHELRTPLNAVIGLSESLLEMSPPFEPARTHRYADIIHRSGRQLLAQINDILDLARIEAGRIQVQAEPMDLGLLCTTAFESSQREIREKHLQLAIKVPPTATMVKADERLLRQVVQNLVGNAVKFTPAGGRIGLTLQTKVGGAVSLAVHDTGIGIPAEKISQLFKPFSQVDSSLSRQFGGTGLGLALVERLVRLHGGTVSVRSVPAQGSTFTVELPAAVALAAGGHAVEWTPRARRIMLVDDDPNQHTLLGDFLRHRGFEVMHCEGARAALEAITTATPGLAIVDVTMPGMSGLELIARLRARPHGQDLPIIAATALEDAEEIRSCRAAGASAHLSKPISLAALSRQIERLTGLTA